MTKIKNLFLILVLYLSVFLSIGLLTVRCFAEDLKENDYTKINCKGQTQVYINGLYCDCVEDDVAYEVEYPCKYKESLTQALLYASYLHKKPGIILLISDFEKEYIYVERLITAITQVNGEVRVKFWLIKK